MTYSYAASAALHQSADELDVLPQMIMRVAEDLWGVAERMTPGNRTWQPIASLSSVRPATSGAHDAAYLYIARQIYQDRRRRSEILPEDLFGEPGWDVLLDLFIAHLEGKLVPVTSACIGAAAPQATAIRWLTMLQERAFVSRKQCDIDRRRIYVEITDEGVSMMKAYLHRTAQGHQMLQGRVRRCPETS